MSLAKSYTRINWENYPSDATPINESNLNKMDYSLNEQDNRIITLDTTKLNVTDANALLKEVSFDESSGVFTFTYYNGTTKTIDTAIEKVAINFDFDETTQEIVLTLVDGTEKRIDVSSFITNNEFTMSDTISFTVTDGVVKADVIDGSITEDKLQANYLADIKVQAQTATNASLSAQSSMESALTYMNNAKTFSENANTSETNAQISQQSASQSAQKASEVEAEAQETLKTVQQAVIDASASATNASTSESNAKTYASKSAQSYADTLAINKTSESWAIGGTGTRDDENSNNSKYYSSLAQTYMDNAQISADKAESYSNIVAPNFLLDDDEMALYIKVGVGVDFLVDDDNVLYWTISA